jgi:hypothetical protein
METTGKERGTRIRLQKNTAVVTGSMPSTIADVSLSSRTNLRLNILGGKMGDQAGVSSLKWRSIAEHRPTLFLQRPARVGEVANAVRLCFLASATNGVALRVDGGVVRSIS